VRALITGASGFAGTHLSQYLLAHTDWELIGTVYPEPVEAQPEEPRLRLAHIDLREPEGVRALVEKVRPDYVFHLAAQSIPSASFADPWGTLETNIRSQVNLLHAVRLLDLKTRVMAIGSNEEYGLPSEADLPLTEEAPLRPHNPYAVSKVAQDLMGLQYHLAYGLEEEAMRVGNLSASRDFSDVRDIVRGYYLAAKLGEPGEVYNLASGQAQSIKGVLDTLLSLAKVEIRIETDPDLYRPVDVPVVCGSAAKFRRLTGWEPEIPFEQTLRDTLDYWRARVAQER
jgi:GDP-4-dehydro-6-deoxy-D-mannose reductase